jgi:hypothetical protein
VHVATGKVRWNGGGGFWKRRTTWLTNQWLSKIANINEQLPKQIARLSFSWGGALSEQDVIVAAGCMMD